ncbi:MAG: hypothetical protein HY849_01755 [Nitrosomonadales bacterium]|nr:hypothetical protein [Nitrosomonadales bacterium]
MATLTMDMSSYKVERAATEEYGDEVMYAGWNPVVGLACEHYRPSMERRSALPPELARVDVDSFLAKMEEPGY